MAVITKTPKGEEIAILSRKEYEELIAASEDARDVEIAARAMARIASGEDKTLSSDEMKELLAAKTPLAFYRKKSGMTQAVFAAQVGIAQGFLSEIEAGNKSGDIRILRRIADALAISLDDLIP